MTKVEENKKWNLKSLINKGLKIPGDYKYDKEERL